MYGTYKWLPEYAAWQQNIRTMGAAAPLTQWSRTLMMDRLPTFNNGFIGRSAQRALSATPGLRGAGSWLSAAHKATPVFRRLGIAGGVVSTGMDFYGLVQQGNPVEAFQREGAGYVADVARTGFSASTTAFLIAPNPVTGGAVIVTGAVWLGAEAWEHREAIADGIATGADWVWDHSMAGQVWNNREAIAAGIDQGIDTAQNFAEGVGERLDEGVDMVESGLSTAADVGGDMLEGAGDVVDDITPW